MAGDWIKIREDLHEDPAVLQIAQKLGTRPEHIVGYCVRFWAWVSRNCDAGSVTGVTLECVESVTNLPQFCHMLCEVGWLEYDDSGDTPIITIPHFERHLSQGAKQRVLTAERNRKYRENPRRKRDAGSVTKPSPEKRREEKSINPPNPPLKKGGKVRVSFDSSKVGIPDCLNTSAFLDDWAKWCRHQDQRGLWDLEVCQAQLESLARDGPALAVARIRHTLVKGWAGLADKVPDEAAPPPKPRVDPSAEEHKRIYRAKLARRNGHATEQPS